MKKINQELKPEGTENIKKQTDPDRVKTKWKQ